MTVAQIIVPAMAGGIAFSLSNVHLPDMMNTTHGLWSQASLPMGLVTVGEALSSGF